MDVSDRTGLRSMLNLQTRKTTGSDIERPTVSDLSSTEGSDQGISLKSHRQCSRAIPVLRYCYAYTFVLS